MFIEQHDARVDNYFGNKRIHLKIFGDKRITSPKFDIPILFGVELEYEVGEATNKRMEGNPRGHRIQVAERLEPTFSEFAICKHDGSMDNGIEIVSIPMSLDAHKEQWKPFFDVAKENSLLVKTNCAMHVHVSREYLTPLHIGQMLAFIHNKANAGLIKAIAGRARPVYTGHRGHYSEIPAKKVTDVKYHLDRYSALNLRGAHTIEFRFFKSTLDISRMIQNIEFCDALMRMTWPSTVSIQQLKDNGVQMFSDFVLKNRKFFPYLFDFLKGEGYIKWVAKKIPLKYQVKKPVEKKEKVKLPKKAARVEATFLRPIREIRLDARPHRNRPRRVFDNGLI